jgi:hypothetical protein
MDYTTSPTAAASAADESIRQQEEQQLLLPLSHTLLLTSNRNVDRDPFEQRVVYIEPRPRRSSSSNNNERRTRQQNPFQQQRTLHEEQWYQRLSYEARSALQFDWQEDEEFMQLLTSDDATLFTPEDYLSNWHQHQQQQEIRRMDVVANENISQELEEEMPPPPYESLVTPTPPPATEEPNPFAQRIIYCEPRPRISNSSTLHRRINRRNPQNNAAIDDVMMELPPPPSYESLFGTNL